MAFKIIRNDITKVKADVLVNSANTEPICAGYRTDAAIYEAAGYDEMLAARQKIGKIEVGHAEVTPAFKLKAKHVIHTVGPRWIDGKSGEPEALRSCYRECLSKAVSLRAKSIAFPLISTGAFGYPKDQALDIALEVFDEFIKNYELEIILVVYDNESFELSSNITDFVESFIDEYYVGVSTEELLEKSQTRKSPKPLIRNEAPVCEAIELAKFAAKSEVLEDVCYSATPVPSFPGKRVKVQKKSKAFFSFTGKLEEDIEKKLAEFEIHSFSDCLYHYINERNISRKELCDGANLDNKHLSKLLSNGVKLPKRETALALAVGLKLSVVETKNFLSYAGYTLTPYLMTDMIVAAFLENKVYDINRINIVLYNYGLKTLGKED